jgi:hypothetical protein
MHNRLNDDHFKVCKDECCLNFKSDAPDYTPTIGNAKEPKDKLYGYIDISWNLQHDDSKPFDCSVRFSLDGGLTFRRCTPAEGTISLRQMRTCPHGLRYTFTWDSEADLSHARFENVRIMILVHRNDGLLLHPFAVDNRVLSSLSDVDEDI